MPYLSIATSCRQTPMLHCNNPLSVTSTSNNYSDIGLATIIFCGNCSISLVNSTCLLPLPLCAGVSPALLSSPALVSILIDLQPHYGQICNHTTAQQICVPRPFSILHHAYLLVSNCCKPMIYCDYHPTEAWWNLNHRLLRPRPTQRSLLSPAQICCY